MPPEKSSSEPKKVVLKQIRTFQGDVAEALKNQNQSLVSIQRAEKSRQETTGTTAVVEEEKKHGEFGKLFLTSLASIVFLALGVIGGTYAYREFQKKTAPPTISVPENRFVSATAESNLATSTSTTKRDSLISTISASEEQETASGEIRQIVLRSGEGTNSLLSTQDFFKIMETSAPGNLTRALDPLFMLGVLGGEPKSTFIIVKLTSFENAFAGMLNWEKSMADDIGPIFASAPEFKNLPPNTVFKDVTTKNKDVRVLSLEDGRPVLLYSFFDNNILIITDRLETLQTLIDRLTREKLAR